MAEFNVVITTRTFGQYSQEPYSVLEQGGCKVLRRVGAERWNEAEMLPLVADAHALIAGTEPVTARVLEAAPLLRMVARCGTGYDSVDLAAAHRRGIYVTYTPGANSEAVADMAMGLMIALARRIVEADASVRAGRWERPVTMSMAGKTLGIIGLGRVGKGLAMRAAGFGMRIVACDVAPDWAFASEHSIDLVTLEEVLRGSDFVSISTPLTAETRELIGESELRMMKDSAFLINTARGGMVDEQALATILQEGGLAGAGLDVFADEPPLDSPLLSLPNVVLTPHVAGRTAESVDASSQMAAADVVRVSRGLPPLYQVPLGA